MRLLNLKKYWLLIVLIVFFAWLFYNLLSSHMLYPKPDGLYSGGPTWGDLALHLTLVSNFAERGLFLHQDPTFYGEKLSYPPFIDMLSAALIKIGFSLRWALIVPSFILIMLSIVLMYVLANEITKSRLAGFLTPFFFFFNGSIVSFKYFLEDYYKSQLSLWEFMKNMPKEYAHLADVNIRFSNIIADYVLPQRTFVAGLALGLVAVFFLWRYWDSRKKNYLLYSGISIGCLPMVHTHTFVALILVAGFLVLIQLFEDTKNFKSLVRDWTYFALPVILIGLPQFAYIFPWGKEGFTKYNFGWMKGDDSIWVFWSKNLSPHIYVFILAFIIAGNKLKKFMVAFLGVFILANLFLFQPHDYDNMKLMLWPFLISTILFGLFIDYLFKKFCYWAIFITIPIIISLILVGSLSVYREYYLSWKMFSLEDIALADFVKNNTPTDSLFLTTDQHNHPIPTLAGRQVLMGFRGWLWTHGVNYQKRESDVFKMFSGGPNAKELILNYGVNYAVIDKNKINDFHINPSFFNSNYQLFYDNYNFTIYKLN